MRCFKHLFFQWMMVSVLASGGNAASYSGYSHQEREGSASKPMSDSSDYSHKKKEGSVRHSQSKKGYSHGLAHWKGSRDYGGRSSYGHGSAHSNNPFYHVLKYKEAIDLTEN